MNNILMSIINKLYETDAGIVALRHYNNFCLNLEDLSFIRNDNKNTMSFHKNFCDSNISEPFAPFLQAVNELRIKHEIRVDEIIETCNIYPLHHEVFESYFTTGVSVRKEKPLINEISFEQQLFVEEVARILEFFSKIEPLCFVLENVSAAGYSTLLEIQKLMDMSIKEISIICTFNETDTEIEYTKELWSSIVSDWDNNDIILDIIDDDEQVINHKNSNITYPINELDDIYVQMCNLFTFTCYRQVTYHLNSIYHKFEVEKISVSAETKFKYYELYATTAMYMDQCSEAMLYLSKMKPLLIELEDKIWKIRYNLTAASIYMYAFQQDIAQKHIDECKQLMDKTDNPFTVFKINLLEHMNTFQGWRNVWMLNKDVTGIELLISECIKYGYDNHLAHIYVYAFDNENKKYVDSSKLNTQIPHFLQGIKIAKRIGNYNFMIEAYKKNVLICSTNGYYSTSNYFNELVRDICIEKNIPTELASTYNGMGYSTVFQRNMTKLSSVTIKL